MKKTVDEILRQYVDTLPRDREKDLQKLGTRAASNSLVCHKERASRPVVAWSCVMAAVLCVCVLGASLLHLVWGEEPTVPSQELSGALSLPTPPCLPDLSPDPDDSPSAPRVVTLTESLGRETKICNGVLQAAGIYLSGEAYGGYGVGWKDSDDSMDGSSSELGLSPDILEEFRALGTSTNQSTLTFYPAPIGYMQSAAFLGKVLEPSVCASQISVSPLHFADGDSGMLGVLLQLGTLEPGAVRSIEAYYVSNGYEVRELAFYEELEASVQWMGREIRYAVCEENGAYVYQLYFQNEESYCCMQARSSKGLEITTFLTEVFA